MSKKQISTNSPTLLQVSGLSPEGIDFWNQLQREYHAEDLTLIEYAPKDTSEAYWRCYRAATNFGKKSGENTPIYSQLNKGVEPIPVVAVSTMDADMLSNIIKNDKEVDLFFRTNCQMLKPEPSYNVIGEIKGSEFPDEIILIGGHLDSWDVGTGAHDDGAGCAHSMDVYQVLKRLTF